MQSPFMIGACPQAVCNSVQEGVVTVDVKGNILYLNQESERILGARSALLIGKSLDQLLGVCLIPDKQDKGSNNLALADIQPDCRELHCMLTLFSEDHRTIRVTHRVLHDRWRKPAGAVVTLSDVSDMLELKQQVARHANYDVLTMLPNRNFLLFCSDGLVASARQQGGDLDCLSGISR